MELKSSDPARKLLLICQILGLLFVTCVILLICWLMFYRWDSKINRGNTYGYWGEFNSTSNALASIPDVKIINSWHNLDLTLEEFGFDIETNGLRVTLMFGETDPIRTMPRNRAIVSLQKEIQTALARSSK